MRNNTFILFIPLQMPCNFQSRYNEISIQYRCPICSIPGTLLSAVTIFELYYSIAILANYFFT